MNWLKPANPKKFDHNKAYEELEVLTWNTKTRNINVGDIVYIYSSQPDSRITHKCIVEKVNVPKDEIIEGNQYVLSSDFDNSYKEGKNHINLRMIEKFKTKKLGYEQLKQHGLKNIQSMNTIPKELLEYIEKVSKKKKHQPNSLNKLIEPKQVDKEKGRSLIIYGVPGSGKSYRIENELSKKNKNVERITFYPEYTYYDFVGQRIPKQKDGKIYLDFEPGIFTRTLAKAFANRTQHYYLIIEEMNRGNAEAIFGDIFQLIDRDKKGGSKYRIYNLSLRDAIRKYIEEEKQKGRVKTDIAEIDQIYIPSNLSIYATINNADQNVFNFDTAFGRRWEYELMPCNRRDNTIYSTGYIKGTNYKWSSVREMINKKILQYRDEIYNAEEKRLGLYYIDEECLKKEKDDTSKDDDYYAEKFANKIFRYLYLNVFKNNEEKIFKDRKILEDYIVEFKKHKELDRILELGDKISE